MDDHKALRDRVRLILEQETDMDVVAEAQNGLMAVQMACETLPDVILMDLSMPVMNGIDATRLIKQRVRAAKVLMLSVIDGKPYIIEALKAGAVGFMFKWCSPEELIAAIRTAASFKLPDPVQAG